MAEQPPLFVELPNTFHAKELGVAHRDLLAEGVISGGLAVSQRAAGANMSVDVAAGNCWVTGDDDASVPTRQPLYRCRNDAVVNLAIAAADATKPRIDRIVAHVYDASFTGAQNKWALEVLAGVATTGATLTNLTGAAAVGASQLLLADVLVPAASATVVNANIASRALNAGVELAYVEVTANFNIINAIVDIIVAPLLTFDGATRVKFEAFCPRLSIGAPTLEIKLRDGATDLGDLGATPSAIDFPGVKWERYFTPTAGQHTYKLSAIAGAAPASIFEAGNGGAGLLLPGFLRISRA